MARVQPIAVWKECKDILWFCSITRKTNKYRKYAMASVAAALKDLKSNLRLLDLDRAICHLGLNWMLSLAGCMLSGLTEQKPSWSQIGSAHWVEGPPYKSHEANTNCSKFLKHIRMALLGKDPSFLAWIHLHKHLHLIVNQLDVNTTLPTKCQQQLKNRQKKKPVLTEREGKYFNKSQRGIVSP